jgi:hypothetical protein
LRILQPCLRLLQAQQNLVWTKEAEEAAAAATAQNEETRRMEHAQLLATIAAVEDAMQLSAEQRAAARAAATDANRNMVSKLTVHKHDPDTRSRHALA